MLKRFRFPGLAICLSGWAAGIPAQEANTAPHVVFVVGEPEYASEQTMPALAEYLQRNYGWQCSVLIDEELQDHEDNFIPNLHLLREADLAVFYLRFRRLATEQLQEIRNYLQSGRPVFGFRTTTHAFDYEEEDPRAAQWNAFGARVLGAPWLYHYGHDSQTLAWTAAEQRGTPLLQGVEEEFVVRSWTYHVRPEYPPLGAQALVFGRPLFEESEVGSEETVNPVAWTLQHPGGGRVFTTTMGHPEDFQEPSFLRLVSNGLHWAMNLKIGVPKDLEFPAVETMREGRDERPGEGPWSEMNYGPFLATVIEAEEENFAYKSINVPLFFDDSEEPHAAVAFDTDLLRWAAGWIGEYPKWADGLVDLQGIVFNGPHGVHPHIHGEEVFSNKMQPGWSLDGRFEDPRDPPFGPLPENHARWKGLFLTDAGVVFHYSVGRGLVWEAAGLLGDIKLPVFVRRLDLSPSFPRSGLQLFAHPEWREFLRVPLRTGTRQDGLPSDVMLLTSEGGSYEDGEALVAGFLARDLRVEWNTDTPGSLRLDLRSAGARPDLSLFLAEIESAEQLSEFVDRLQPVSESPRERIASSSVRWGEAIRTEGDLRIRTEKEEDIRSLSREPSAPSTVEIPLPTPDANLRLEDWRGETLQQAVAAAHTGIAVAYPKTTAMDSALKRVLTGAWDFDEGEGEELRNSVTGKPELRLEGVTWRRGISGKSLDFDGTGFAEWMDAGGIDLLKRDCTFAVWIHTTKDGVIFSKTMPEEIWVPDGKVFFVRDGRLAFDIGWVGVVEGKREVADGSWHHVAFSYDHSTKSVRLFVDGVLDGEGQLAPKNPVEDHVVRLGFAAEDFPPESWFSGYMEGLRIFSAILDSDQVRQVAAASGEPLVHAWGVTGNRTGVQWTRYLNDSKQPRLKLRLGAAPNLEDAYLHHWQGRLADLGRFRQRVESDQEERSASFRVDRVTWPADNPFASWMRFGDFDFFSGGDKAALTTWSGDVWTVSGLGSNLEQLNWRRIATGIQQPLGLKIVSDQVFVLGRQEITRLQDRNGDGETDFYECWNSDTFNTEHFHEPCSGLQTDSEGNFYYLKAARHAKKALHAQHGTLIRVSYDGTESTVLARGFRAPNGLWRDSDGTFYNSDQEGHWMPANRINWIRTGGFYGNNWAGPPGLKRTRFDPPLCWIHPSVDRSPSSQLRLQHPQWGVLQNKLIGLSYGTGEVYMVLEEETADGRQGGVTPLGIQLPTGLMRGRENPQSGNLYVCGLFGWSSDQTEPGGFYRIRPGEAAPFVPLRVDARRGELEIVFSVPLRAATAEDVNNYQLSAWNYRWSEQYGSPDLRLEDGLEGRTTWPVRSAKLFDDGTRLVLKVPDLQPCMQMHLVFQLQTSKGIAFDSYLHYTIHTLDG